MRLRHLAATLALLLAPCAPALAISRVPVVSDCSGALTTGGASQSILAVDANRLLLIVQNPIGAAGPLFVNFGPSASVSTGSIELAPGGSLVFLAEATPTTAVAVNSATQGARWICKAGGIG